MRIWNTAVSEKRDLMEYYTMWVHQIKTPIAALKLLIEEDIPGEEEPFGADRERLQQQREKRRDEELQQLFAIEQYVNMALSYMRLGSETTDFDRSRRSDPDGGAPLCETFHQQEDRTALRGDGGTGAHR